MDERQQKYNEIDCELEVKSLEFKFEFHHKTLRTPWTSTLTMTVFLQLQNENITQGSSDVTCVEVQWLCIDWSQIFH